MLSPIFDTSADEHAAIKPAELADNASVVKVQSAMVPLLRILTLAEQANRLPLDQSS